MRGVGVDSYTACCLKGTDYFVTASRVQKYEIFNQGNPDQSVQKFNILPNIGFFAEIITLHKTLSHLILLDACNIDSVCVFYLYFLFFLTL